MSDPNNFKFTATKMASAVAIALLSGQAGAASILADGKLDTTYQLGYSISFLDDTGHSIGDGKLYFGINGSDNTQFLYFQLPLSYVDNTYGTNAAADWTKGHTFSDLLGSDRWGVIGKKSTTGGFEWATGSTTNSVTFDYIAGVCSGSTCGTKTPAITGYRSGGVGTALNDGATIKNDGSVNAGSAGSILEIATSLEYDLNVVDASATTNSSLNANWIKEVGYEIQFAAGTFDAASWIDVASNPYDLFVLGSVHASPNKMAYTEYGDPVCIQGCITTAVPEPESWLLLSAGLGLLGWASRRRKRS